MSDWKITELGYENDSLLVGPPPNEDALAYAYLKMKEHGVLDTVFHQSKADLRFFLDWLLNPQTMIIGAWERPTPDVVRLVGMSFFNQAHQIEGLNKAEVGFAFWGEPVLSIFTKAQIIRRYMDYLFTRTKTDSIFGLTPEPNAAAVALIRRAGMRVYGPIPMYCGWHGRPVSATISQMDAQTWLNGDLSLEYHRK